MKIIKFNTARDFYLAHENYLEDNSTVFNTILSYLKLADKDSNYKTGYRIEDENNKYVFLLCLFIGEYKCILNSHNWNETLVKGLSNIVEFIKTYTNPTIYSGKTNLVKAVIHNYGIEYEEGHGSDRIIYECDTVNKLFKPNLGLCELANENDAMIMYRYMLECNKQEHKGFQTVTNKAIENMVINGLGTKTFYKWRYKGKITSIIQIEKRDGKLPLIAHFFTSDEFKNQSFGKSLLASVTKILLKEYEAVGLASDANFPYSNQAFKSIGFVQVYEYLTAPNLAYLNKLLAERNK